MKNIAEYHNITATEEFRTIEWTRRKTEHDAAQAMTNAINNAEKRRDEHWQSVVADKDEHWQSVVADKDEHWQSVVADKDEHWQSVVADKEIELKKQADLIAELEKKLGIKI